MHQHFHGTSENLLTPSNETLLIEYKQSYTEVCKDIDLSAFAELGLTDIVDVQASMWDMCKCLPSCELDRLRNDPGCSSQLQFNALARMALHPSEDSETHHATQTASEHGSEKTVTDFSMPPGMLLGEVGAEVNTSTIVQRASSSHSSPLEAIGLSITATL
jgi:hypothetical protein